MKYSLYILVLLALLMQMACHNNSTEIITKKIQYDVNIKSPNPDYDWWIQNLVGPQRDKLVDLIIAGAKSGKWQAYDYFNDSINKYEVRDIFADTTVVAMTRTTPPYETFDTMIIRQILPHDIERLRFMEEWSIDKQNLQFKKKVIGIAPIARRLDFNGIERWQPLFWIYTDKDFINSIKNHK